MSDWWSADPVAGSKPDFGKAISSIESGGNYRAVGPPSKTGDRAFGKYQVMGANIGPWTQEVFGKPMSRQEFLLSPEAQEKVFQSKFGQYVEKHGPEGAARAWFAGEGGMNNPNAKDVLGTTVSAYAGKFNAVTSQPAQDNWWNADPVADAPASPVADRFVEPSALPNAPAMEAGLQARARQMTTGPQTSPAQRMALQHDNLLSAASQGATPNTDILGKNLISTEVLQGDDGSIQYRDPQTGQVVPTDNTKHIALRDPADNTIKIYARTAEAEEGPVTGTARVLAPGLMAGAVTKRPSIPVPAAKDIVPRASDIMATAKPSYRAFEQQAKATPMPQGAGDRLVAALDRINMDVDMAGPSAKAAIKKLEGENLTLDILQRAKKAAGYGFASPDKAVRDGAGAITAEIARIINEVAPSASANLKRADDIHSTALAVQNLQRKSDVADLRKGRAGYGGNAVNTMRQVLSPIVQRSVEGRHTGFKPNEIAAMREIVEGTPSTNALRWVGQFSPSSGLGALRSAGAGGTAMFAGASGTMAAAIPAIGFASNKLATVLTGKQIDRLKELVAKRSPAYADAVSKAVERYERAQMEFVNQPSPNKFAAYLSASRALSSGLTRDGVQVTSGDLLRRLNSPAQVAADDQEPGPRIPGQ